MKNQIENACNAVARLGKAASALWGRDCFTLAGLLFHLLRSQGVQTRYCAGQVAWRVGDGDSDVIAHSPLASTSEVQGIAGHAWLEATIDGQTWIIDCTTAQLRHKAALIDQLDGGKTSVTWAPEALFVKANEMVASFQAVANGNAGAFWYQAHEQLSAYVAAKVLPNIDEEDVAILQILSQQPHLAVVGPCSITSEIAGHI